MPVSAPQHCQGWSKLELAVSVALISVFVYGLLQALYYTEEQAEKNLFERTVAALQTAVRLEAGSRTARGRQRDIVLLEDENPFRYLDVKPQHYRGELPDAAQAQPGDWYFDRNMREIVYLPANAEHFRGADGSRDIRLRVEANNGTQSGVNVVAVRPYTWF